MIQLLLPTMQDLAPKPSRKLELLDELTDDEWVELLIWLLERLIQLLAPVNDRPNLNEKVLLSFFG